MNTVIIIVAILLGVIGIVGSVIPAIPGPWASWIAMLLLYFGGRADTCTTDPMTINFLIIWLGITILVTILDNVIAPMFTKLTGGHKAAVTGSIIGMVIGIFLTPIGMIAGCLAGAFLGELMVQGQDATGALKAALGAFAGFIAGTGAKLLTTGIMMFYIIQYSF